MVPDFDIPKAEFALDRPLYYGDDFYWFLRFADEGTLAGGVGSISAPIRRRQSSAPPVASWTPTIDGVTVKLMLSPVGLVPGRYETEVRVAGVTYMRKVWFDVEGDVAWGP